MNEWIFVGLILLTGIGSFGSGACWGGRHILFWRIKWIEMEHDLARLQKRKPRNISEVEKVSNK